MTEDPSGWAGKPRSPLGSNEKEKAWETRGLNFDFCGSLLQNLLNVLLRHSLFFWPPRPFHLSWSATLRVSFQLLVPTPKLAICSLPLFHLPLLCDLEWVTCRPKSLVPSAGDGAPVLEGLWWCFYSEVVRFRSCLLKKNTCDLVKNEHLGMGYSFYLKAFFNGKSNIWAFFPTQNENIRDKIQIVLSCNPSSYHLKCWDRSFSALIDSSFPPVSTKTHIKSW